MNWQCNLDRDLYQLPFFTCQQWPTYLGKSVLWDVWFGCGLYASPFYQNGCKYRLPHKSLVIICLLRVNHLPHGVKVEAH